jgi:hypothetical protein
MLIGQERAGKTSLKKSLLGLSFDPKEASTVGIDADPSCFCVDVDHVKNWRRAEDDKLVNDFTDSIARIMVDDLNQNRQVREPESSLVRPNQEEVQQVSKTKI